MDQTELVKQKLAEAERITALTGAGISAESGVPTFRGEEGLWRNYDPMELATPEAFAKDPKLVWEWYLWRRELMAQCRPNEAHRALVMLELQKPGFSLITQNVDGLHRLAGNRQMLEIHGDLWTVRCTGCQAVYEERSLELSAPPSCKECGGLLRPNVVWFGESLDQTILARAWEAAALSQVMLVVGTSAVVQPAASLATVAKSAGAFVVEVNLDPTPNSSWVDVSLMGKAAEVLPGLIP